MTWKNGCFTKHPIKNPLFQNWKKCRFPRFQVCTNSSGDCFTSNKTCAMPPQEASKFKHSGDCMLAKSHPWRVSPATIQAHWEGCVTQHRSNPSTLATDHLQWSDNRLIAMHWQQPILLRTITSTIPKVMTRQFDFPSILRECFYFWPTKTCPAGPISQILTYLNC